MANKRELKKYVEALGSSVCENMMTSYYNVEGVDREAIMKAMSKVLTAITRSKDAANTTFGKRQKEFASEAEYLKAKREFFITHFKSICSEFVADVNEALSIYNAALPQSVKDQNKAEA